MPCRRALVALQTFLGLFTLELARSDGTTDFDRSLSIYRQVRALCLQYTHTHTHVHNGRAHTYTQRSMFLC